MGTLTKNIISVADLEEQAQKFKETEDPSETYRGNNKSTSS